MNPLHPARIGAAVRTKLADLGLGTRLFVRLCLLTGVCLRRFGLVRDQIHFLGNYSLGIIGVSGLFVGFVMALQGYYTLQDFGSADALGQLVALSLIRELGPVVTALLKGETYVGRAFVVDRWYITAYEPIKDAAGEVVAALYVGIPQESAASLRKAIMATKVGTACGVTSSFIISIRTRSRDNCSRPSRPAMQAASPSASGCPPGP